MEIVGYEIKEAVVQAIRAKYPGAKYYFDNISAPVYPNFFIRFVEVTTERIARNLYRFWFDISVQYREVADPATAVQLNTKLDKVGNDLNNILQTIEIYGSKRPCTNVRTSIIDDLTQGFATLTLIGSMPQEPVDKMEEIQVKEELG